MAVVIDGVPGGGYKDMTDEDAYAVAAYLKSVAPRSRQKRNSVEIAEKGGSAMKGLVIRVVRGVLISASVMAGGCILWVG